MNRTGLLRVVLGVSLAALLGGCGVSKWVGVGGEPVVAGDHFTAPNPGRGVGLRKVWKESLSAAAKGVLPHPGRIVVTGDRVYVATAEEGGLFSSATRGMVNCLEVGSGRVIWRADLPGAASGGVAVDENLVYVGTLDGDVVALRRDKGELAWKTRVSTKVTSAPAVARDRLLVTTLDSRTYALNTADGSRVWIHASTPESLVLMGGATPTVVGDTAFVGYPSGEVFALGTADGKVRWTANLTAIGGRSEVDLLQDVDASIVLSSRKIFAVNHQGHVAALFPPTGARVWERRASAIRSPLLLGRRLIVADVEGNVLALDAEDGGLIWQNRVSDGLLTAPVLLGEQVLIGDNRGRLMTLDPASGRVTGLDQVDEELLADPVVTERGLLLWTNRGNLIRYESGS
ncbi:MAG: PQQ-binding-like beta-propeller repeat protein [Magnetococcales bacterium]|nr:PQQ-binding-like beta-propeller repeat protein [Magnetococcales bacterium]